MPDPCLLQIGDRTARITVTTNLSTYDGTTSNLVDGGFSYPTNADLDGLGIGLNDMTIAPGDFHVTFDFDEAISVTSLRIYQSSADQAGFWQPQQWDGATWVNVGSVVWIDALTDQTFDLSMNVDTGNAFRLLSDNGITNAFQYWMEFEFGIDGCSLITPVDLEADFTDASVFLPQASLPAFLAYFSDDNIAANELDVTLSVLLEPADLFVHFEDSAFLYAHEGSEFNQILIQSVVITTGS